MSQLARNSKETVPSVLIVQPTIPDYRIPFFNGLAATNRLTVTVAHSGQSTTSRQILYNEIRVTKWKIGGFWYQKGILSIVNNYDAVIVPLNPRWIHADIMCLLKFPQKLLLWGHGTSHSGWADKLRGWASHRADAVILYDRKAGARYTSLLGTSDKIFIAPNTIHVANAGYNPGFAKRDFLFVGRLQQRKRLNDLLLAFSIAACKLPSETGLIIVGDGDIKSELQALASSLGIAEKVTFCGKLTDADKLKSIFQRALAYVSPGDVGLGVLHSFAYGVPVITRQNARHGPEFNNIVHALNGLIYDGAVEKLAEIFVRLSEHPEEAVRMGANAYRQYVGCRTIEHMILGFCEAVQYSLDVG